MSIAKIIDHAIAGEPLDLYDIGDQKKFEVFDIIGYMMYLPYAYISVLVLLLLKKLMLQKDPRLTERALQAQSAAEIFDQHRLHCVNGCYSMVNSVARVTVKSRPSARISLVTRYSPSLSSPKSTVCSYCSPMAKKSPIS